MCAIVDKKLTVEEAVKLSRLEVDFQVLVYLKHSAPHNFNTHTLIQEYRQLIPYFYLPCRSSIGVTWNGHII